MDDRIRISERLAPLDTQRFAELSAPRTSQQPADVTADRAEKALHHLVVIGVVRDYTVDYRATDLISA